MNVNRYKIEILDPFGQAVMVTSLWYIDDDVVDPYRPLFKGTSGEIRVPLNPADPLAFSVRMTKNS